MAEVSHGSWLLRRPSSKNVRVLPVIWELPGPGEVGQPLSAHWARTTLGAEKALKPMDNSITTTSPMKRSFTTLLLYRNTARCPYLSIARKGAKMAGMGSDDSWPSLKSVKNGTC